MFLKKKPLRIINFMKQNIHTSNLFNSCNLLIIFIYKCLNKSWQKTFKNWFSLSTASHTHNIWWCNSDCLKIPSHNMKLCGRYWVKISGIYTCNCSQELHVNILFYQLPLAKLKDLFKKCYTSNHKFHLCSFGFFITKQFFYFNLTWFCDLFLEDSSSCFCPTILELTSDI